MPARRKLLTALHAIALTCAPALSCDDDLTTCSSNADCGGSELCVERSCHRVCNVAADCPADQRCSEGICWPVVTTPADAGPTDTDDLDSHDLDANVLDSGRPDQSSLDRTAPDSAALDAGGVVPCTTIAHGGATCGRGCPRQLLHHSTAYDETQRQGFWLCGQPSHVTPTPLISPQGGAAQSVTPRPAVTPTDRTVLVGGSYKVR